jgi:filamentous hemagglutinin
MFKAGRWTLASLLVLLTASVPTEAGNILRKGGSSSSAAAVAALAVGAPTIMNSPGAVAAKNMLARTATALQNVRNLQYAARNIPIGSPVYPRYPAGFNLRPGNALLNVQDGLTDNATAIAQGNAGGLTPDNGTIVPDPNNPGSYIWTGTWNGVGSMSQQPSNDANGQPGKTVTIVQNAQQALLNWQTFNVGSHTTLNFDQGAGGANVGAWIAFNKINDPLGRPSQILGSINSILGPTGKPGSGGQVYVINTNGIIFGGSSQVNTHALVASSLPVDSNAIAYLLNQQKTPVLFDGLSLPPTTAIGNVEVQPGAQLTAPATADNAGGLVALIGPNVYNGGTISTEDGQTILAAGLQVGLVAHSSNDPSLRGLDAYVGAVVDPSGNVTAASGAAGTATNDMAPDGTMGLIEALHGNVTMVGQTVNQLGFINSSTSAALNGRVDLLADYGAISNPTSLQFFLTQTGTVTLGPNSVTQILPDLTSPGNTGTQLALSSMVNIQGQAIHLASANGDPKTGAVILAPGAAIPSDPTKPAYGLGSLTSPLTSGVTLNAGSWYLDEPVTGLDANAKGSFVNTNGQIYLDSGATIDVSGSQVENASAAENIVSVQLLGPQLANSPLQRAGLLRGQTINVDIRQFGSYDGQEWVGTPLADTTGYINLIQRSVGELTTTGGTVALNAGESVVMQSGSSINVSGGWIHYLPGVVQTTQVLSNGHFIDISKATPDLVFDGIYTGTFTTTDAKWGVTQTYTNPAFHNGSQYESAYYQGGNGGSLFITAPAMALDGDLFGNTVAGSYQRTSAASIATTFAGSAALPTVQSVLGVPTPGALSLSFYGQQQVPDPKHPGQFVQDDFVRYTSTPPEIVIALPDGKAAAVNPFELDGNGSPVPLSQDLSQNLPLRQNLVELSPDLVDPQRNGFGLLSIDNSYDGYVGYSSTTDGNGVVTNTPIVQGNTVTAGSDLGKIIVAPGVTLNLPAAGSLSLSAANIDIEGNIAAPSGSLRFNAYDLSPNWASIISSSQNSTSPITNAQYDRNRGYFILGNDVTLSTAGLWVDDRASSSTAGSQPLMTNGGQILIQGSTVGLGGGTLNVSGGVQVNGASKLAYGSGGSLTINAGKDLSVSSILGGVLTGLSNSPTVPVAAILQGYAGVGKSGGLLSVQVPLIQVGGAVANYDPLLLSPEFFNQDGFSSFTLTGLGAADTRQASGFDPAVYIAPGTTLDPTVQNFQATLSATSIALAPMTSEQQQALQPSQRTPVNLSFMGSPGIINQTGTSLLTRGDIVVGPGAVIQANPGTNSNNGVTLRGDTVAVLGSVKNQDGSVTPGAKIIANGGSINISGRSSAAIGPNGDANHALPTVDLAPGSVLDASGVTVLTPDPTGHGIRTGTVLDGGKIAVSGNIVAEGEVDDQNGNLLFPAAMLNVSGFADQVYVLLPYTGANAAPNTPASGARYVREEEDSNGGSITFSGKEELYTDAKLLGAAGGPTAQGGTLAVSSGKFYSVRSNLPASSDILLTVQQSGRTIPTAYSNTGLAVIGAPVPTNNVDDLGQGHFAVDSFETGGFDSLTLGVPPPANSQTAPTPGGISFSDSVDIWANRSLVIGNGGVIYAAGAVNLWAPYVQLGLPFLAPANSVGFNSSSSPVPTPGLSPTFGPGSLSVNASDLIDIGNLSLQGIGTATINANSGDIRGDGTFDIQGAVWMNAGQIYAPTATAFTVAAYDSGTQPGTVTITNRSSVTRSLPLSAGSTLNIYASKINQGGVLRAPIGTINLGWNGTGTAPIDPNTGASVPVSQSVILAQGSVTSVSAAGLTIPYGINLNGTSWIDPVGTDITVSGNGAAGAGLPDKSVNISARDVEDQGGSKIDLSGGGDLYAYRWVTGLGGSNDILNTTSSFAVIPSYQADYAPFAPYNGKQTPTGPKNLLLDANHVLTDPGYVSLKSDGSSALSVGDSIYLGASNGLPSGNYTLLPARYALLPGAFLVTPQNGLPTGTVSRPDGSSLVSGYKFNDLSAARPLFSSFEVDPQSVVTSRAEYDPSYANSFLSQSAQTHNLAIPRLPIDSGQLVLNATTKLTLAPGGLVATPPVGGLGSLVDITSANDIGIVSPNATTQPSQGALVLDSNDLSQFGAESLLIGGTRQTTTKGTLVTVTTNKLIVDNSGEPLTGPDVILVANQDLELKPGADVEQGAHTLSSPAESLQVGQNKVLGSGDNFTVSRAGVEISFPQGTPTIDANGNPTTDTITADIAATVTSADGKTTTEFPTGTSFSVPVGGRLTLNGNGSFTFASNNAGDQVSFVIGDGSLLRVSSDAAASIARAGVTGANPPSMVIGAGAKIGNTVAVGSVTLDSTGSTLLNSTGLSAKAINLDSGKISIEFDGGNRSLQDLALSGDAVNKLENLASSLSLLSYSSIDLYGTGRVGTPAFSSIALHADEIRDASGGNGDNVQFFAQNILLDNRANGTLSGLPPPLSGNNASTITFDAGMGTIELGVNQLAIDQYNTVTLNAGGGILVQGQGTVMPQGEHLGLTTQGNLVMTAPWLTGTTGAHQTIMAGGSLSITPGQWTAARPPEDQLGLGDNLTFVGANGVTDSSNITLPSGTLTLHATTSGHVSVGGGGVLDVSGTEKDFFDEQQFTSGGQVTLTSDQGSVNLLTGSKVDVSAQPGGGNAGSLTISAPTMNNFTVPVGVLSGQGSTVVDPATGTGGVAGTFSLDVGGIPSGNLDSLAGILSSAGFTHSVSIRDQGDASVALNGTVKASTVNLSADSGSINVTGTGMIDASGATGGTINLEAHDNVALAQGSSLTVKGEHYDDAGKGGSISLSAGSYTSSSFNQSAKVDIQSGAQIDLNVTNQFTAGDMMQHPDLVAHPERASLYDNRTDLFTGKLLLSEPQFAFGDGTALLTALGNNISNINNASNIVLAGLHVFDLSGTGGGATIQNHSLTSYFGSSDIIDNVETDVMAYGQNFVNPVYINAGNLGTLNLRNKAGNILINVEPSAEIVNNNPGNNAGNLELQSYWDLSASRFGPNSAPGILTLRAAGNLIFDPEASLSDGFGTGTAPAGSTTALWQAQLLPPGSQSWSYNLVAGADVTAADFRQLQPLATLLAASTPTGSLLLGNGSLGLPSNPSPLSRSAIIPQFYQVIRTGTGDINISAGLDVQFLNPLAAIYTAGTAAGSVPDFDLPDLANNGKRSQIGPPQGPIYPAQYSLNGGNVTIFAQDDIVRTTVDSNGNVIPDSSKEMPTNWLYRRGYVNGGQFGPIPTPANQLNPQIASTSWWVDFSNFFEDVGALGGGNVTLTAGRDISNIDAVVPTNARMTNSVQKIVSGQIQTDKTPADQTLVELGGGDLMVSTGRDINGGVYYVERGTGTLNAGGSIDTNATRSTLLLTDAASLNGAAPDPTTWLPTTLFLGKGGFDVSANGSVLLGSVANPFLLPQGINNSYLLRTFFSTFASNDSVKVSSLVGDVAFKEGGNASDGSLAGWYDNILSGSGASLGGLSQPWLRLTEIPISGALTGEFGPAASFLPGTLKSTAFSGSIDLVNGLTLSPSATGTLDLVAAQSINGLQPARLTNDTKLPASGNPYLWNSGTITLSDADPSSIPDVFSPVAVISKANATNPAPIPESFPTPTVTILTTDTGATSGPFATLQAEQALHASIKDSAGVSGPLHADDTTGPVHLSAENGDISGLTLFSAKSAQVSAGNDITDVGLYVQNVNATDISVVSAGRDIIAYDQNTPLQGLSNATGNAPPATQNTGDIQISGPGTLEVLAGRNLTLGVSQTSPTTSDGTSTGITSVGNARNLTLPFTGANVTVGAGLNGSQPDFADSNGTGFIDKFLNPTTGGTEAARYLPEVGAILGLSTASNPWTVFSQLPVENQDGLALDLFYLVLRDAGRDFNDPSSPSYKNNYNNGFAAIAALFPDHAWQGDISLTSREIKTENGGDISIFAPGGQLTVGLPVAVDRPADQGILTAHGGNISIFANGSVNVGFSRIFTLRGGNEIIWSSTGNIDAGSASKTVQAAPPTRVLVDPQSANVTPDLSGLATGGGIGVLETVAGVPPANIDLIAPVGTIDAGDAGIRASGKLNIAAAQVLNAGNISAASTTTSAPPPPAAPNVAGIASASNTNTSSSNAAAEAAREQQRNQVQQQEFPSIITVEVLGYGGSDLDNEKEKDKDKDSDS